MQKEYEYTYKIKNINLQEVSLIVEYKPTDTSLTSYTFPIPGFIKTEEGVVLDVHDIIKMYAPHFKWEGQETLALAHSEITLTSVLVEPTTNA